ncbi:MAG: IS3 family transposase [Lachnospira eligens]
MVGSKQRYLMISILQVMKNITYEVEKYIRFFNEERPAYSLNYLTPKQYREYYAH